MSAELPLFSVVVANYNNGRFLPQLVSSLEKQTYPNWELIITDDASKDDSVSYIKSVAEGNDRIRYVLHEHNQGAGATFKSSTDASKGELIAMLGADDALAPNALEEMHKAHEQYPNASLITSMADDCDEEMNPIGLCKISGEQPEGLSFLYDVKVGNMVSFKKEAYQKTTGFDPDQIRAVDHDIFLKLEEVGDVKFVDKVLYYYRRHQGGISQGSNGTKASTYSLKAKLKAYNRRLASGYQPNLTQEEFKISAWTYYIRESVLLREQGEILKAIQSNIKSVSYKPAYVFKRQFLSGFYQAFKSALKN